jgi:hypothetical protein
MSLDNPLWGAPRIHGEVLKLGFEIAQSSVAKYMVKRREPPSQGWRTFLHNHAPEVAAMDFFVVPTIGFDLLYAFVIVRLDRRELVWINVTRNPTAAWVARQITEAFPSSHHQPGQSFRYTRSVSRAVESVTPGATQRPRRPKAAAGREVVCGYFCYAQRETDAVLDALVRKTERIIRHLIKVFAGFSAQGLSHIG